MIQFPNNRLTYTGQQGPVYDNDGQNAINNLYAAINMLLGLSSTGFAILSGFAVTGNVGGNDTFGPGYFYLNGVVYYSAGVSAGQCLVPSITQINNALFADGNLRYTYEIYNSVTSNTATSATSPLLTNNIDPYRLNLTVLNTLFNDLNENLITTIYNVGLKADKVIGGASGNFVALNGSGDIVDSGKNNATYDLAGSASAAQAAALIAAEGLFTSGVGSFTPASNFKSGTVTCNYIGLNGLTVVTIILNNILTNQGDNTGLGTPGTNFNSAGEQKLGSINPTIAPPTDIYIKPTYIGSQFSDTSQDQNYIHIDNGGNISCVSVKSASHGMYAIITFIV